MSISLIGGWTLGGGDIGSNRIAVGQTCLLYRSIRIVRRLFLSKAQTWNIDASRKHYTKTKQFELAFKIPYTHNWLEHGDCCVFMSAILYNSYSCSKSFQELSANFVKTLFCVNLNNFDHLRKRLSEKSITCEVVNNFWSYFAMGPIGAKLNSVLWP